MVGRVGDNSVTGTPFWSQALLCLLEDLVLAWTERSSHKSLIGIQSSRLVCRNCSALKPYHTLSESTTILSVKPIQHDRQGIEFKFPCRLRLTLALPWWRLRRGHQCFRLEIFLPWIGLLLVCYYMLWWYALFFLAILVRVVYKLLVRSICCLWNHGVCGYGPWSVV